MQKSESKSEHNIFKATCPHCDEKIEICPNCKEVKEVEEEDEEDEDESED